MHGCTGQDPCPEGREDILLAAWTPPREADEDECVHRVTGDTDGARTFHPKSYTANSKGYTTTEADARLFITE